jgi:3-hydroxybutyryl-CoA dehydratase
MTDDDAIHPAGKARGRYFEEFAIGDTVTSAGRTIEEADILQFATLSGDENPLHTDADAARRGPFGQQIAHGLLGLSIATGLLLQLGFLVGTILVFRELTWKFSLPIFIGDTIHAQATTAELKLIPRMKAGAITFAVDVVNQAGKTVQAGRWMVLVACRPD